ncbi:MAG TPA: O-antigen ligase family protein [Bryobacteraceae bacterium]|jgi:O-antigen ligase|nr:O-antigen ligase family protein [Bryobacteraceae bacterium]
MNQPEPILLRSARWLTFGSAVAILLSIAISQILLALAVAALLMSGEKLRLPPIKLPLALFMAGTVISLAFSAQPAAGLPQIRKFFVFLELLVVFSTLRKVELIRGLVLSWAAVGGLIAIRGLVQFAGKVQEARALGRNFYDYYAPAERISGFMSHWMTFSGQEMFVLLLLLSFLFFAPNAFRRGWVWVLCAGLMSLALLLGFTRSIWLASAVSGVYLVWFLRRWLVALVPLAAALVFLFSPSSVRERFTSILRPKQGVDSNEFRNVTRRTGVQMIREHPLLGLGPEGIKLHFMDYVPADIPKPLPSGWYGHLHNIYLQYAAERGIPTALVLMWLLLKILFDFGRGLRGLPPGRSDRKFLLHGGIAVVVATMVAGFFEVNLGDSEVLTMFLVTVACGYLSLEKELAAA